MNCDITVAQKAYLLFVFKAVGSQELKIDTYIYKPAEA